MPWLARLNYLSVLSEQKRYENYVADLIWLQVKNRYPSLPQPSLVASGKPLRDTRSANDILNDIQKKFAERAKKKKQQQPKE